MERSLLALWCLNLVLRFWRLDTPTPLTFDEVYYVAFATDILQNQPFFDAHPPLGKQLIALSIAGFQASQQALGLANQSLAAVMANPVSYRWLNAGIGATIPLLGGWVAWEWSRGYTHRRRQIFTHLSALLLSADGLLLVESRLALLHVALVGFGLVGLAAWARSHHCCHPLPWRLLAGLVLGACINVKWNGAGYLLALWCLEGIRTWRDRPQRQPPQATRPWLWLGILPCGVYLLCWLPYLKLTGQTLWGIHRHLWQFHIQAGAHPYQSAWYTWPLMIRPIAYFYQGLAGNESVGIGPATPSPTTAISLYGMNHPFLVWLGTAAIALLIVQKVGQFRQRSSSAAEVETQNIDRAAKFGDPTISRPRKRARLKRSAIKHLRDSRPSPSTAVVITYLANWLPWAFIQRSTFFYHYFSSALMAEIALAWLMSHWLTSNRPSWHWAAGSLLGLIVAGFIFWLPLWIGWPLSLEALQQRWWVPSWR